MEKINAKGLLCPVPVIEVKKVIARLPKEGGVVSITVDNQIATENLSKLCAQKGYNCEVTKRGEGEYEVVIAVGAAVSGGLKAETIELNTENKPNILSGDGKRLAVAVGKDSMGSGSDELGKILIKGFIYSLLNLEAPPKTLVFFNSGVKLAVNGANTLSDLQALERAGTKILVCGTCVDFYGCKAEVAVGEITNMYNIVEALQAADSVINI